MEGSTLGWRIELVRLVNEWPTGIGVAKHFVRGRPLQYAGATALPRLRGDRSRPEIPRFQQQCGEGNPMKDARLNNLWK